MSRKKKLPLLENIEITDVAAEGKSIARVENQVLFVQGLVPGDIADIQVIRKRKRFMEGRVVTLKKLSEERETPFCGHFGICGGCKWQVLPYEKQLYYKKAQVSDQLKRLGKVEIPPIKVIRGSEFQRFYRNKLEFTFSANRWLNDEEIQSGDNFTDRRALGFHLQGKFDRVFNVEKCYLQHELSNRILNEIRQYTLNNDYSYYHQRNTTGLLRNLIIRNTSLDQWMVIIVFREQQEEKISGLMEHVRKQFPELNSLLYVINPKVNDTINDLEVKVYSGHDHIFEEFDGLRFKIGPKSFFQTNIMQARELYRMTSVLAELKGDEVVYDLYTGTGTIANYIAGNCRKVIGIEYIPEAIEDAWANAALNQIENVEFFAGDIKNLLNSDFVAKNGTPDVVITDPPRAGMHTDVVEAIIEARPEKIIYISCNPATQARDVQILDSHYRVYEVQPVDMFPHTQHVENIIRLDRK